MFGDPYLEWSAADGFAGHAAMRDAAVRLPVLVEATPDQAIALLGSPLLRTPGAAGPLPAGPEGLVYLSGTADRQDLPALEKLVRRLEFGLPLAAGAVDPQPPPDAASSRRVVLAVVDRGCALLNPVFRDSRGRPRLIGLWDQARPPSGDWRAPPGFGYGRELDAQAIVNLVARTANTPEAALYRGLDYLVDAHGQLQEAAHGTHVLDTLAGRPAVRPGVSEAKPAEEDEASRARLLFVDLPPLGPGDSTGAAPGAHLIDALHYIRQRSGPSTPVVVNLSVGALAGPHDGSSLVERALDHFVWADGHMQVFVAGGNAASERWHASGRLGPSEAPVALAWRLVPDDPTDSFMEVWFDGAGAGAELRLTPPGGPAGPWVRQDRQHIERRADGRLRSGVFGRTSPGNGRGMFLVALGPCAGTRRAAPAGCWTVELRHTGRACLFDAWLQRDEPGRDFGLPVQSRLERVEGPARIDPEGTENSLATGREVVAVGATDLESGLLASYSAGGRGVTRFAAADESQVAVGLWAAGVAAGTRVRMGGTSVAAPRLARRQAAPLKLGRLPPAERPKQRPRPRER